MSEKECEGSETERDKSEKEGATNEKEWETQGPRMGAWGREGMRSL